MYGSRMAELRDEETRQLSATVMNSMLATNGRHMNDEDRARYLRDLEPPDAARRRPRVKVTPAFARQLQAAARRQGEATGA